MFFFETILVQNDLALKGNLFLTHVKSSQHSLSIPPENIRKPFVFQCFQRGYRKGNIGLIWVNTIY